MVAHFSEIERLTDENNLTTTKPYPRRSISNCQTKRKSTPMVNAHDVVQTPYYLVYVLMVDVINNNRRPSIVNLLHR